MDYCKECGAWLFFGVDRHTCPPKWEWKADYHDFGDFYEVSAHDAEEAAQKAAERYDEEDHDLIRNQGDAMVFYVRQVDTEEVFKFSVHAEAVPTYYATEIKD